MPFSDVSFWESVSKWAIGVLSTVTAMFVALVNKWFGDRFTAVHERMDKQDKRITDHQMITERHAERLSEHENKLGNFDTHLEYIRKDGEDIKQHLRELNNKMDKIVSG